MPGPVPPDRRVVLLVSERADFYGGGQRSLLDLAAFLAGGPFAPAAVIPGPGPLAEALARIGVPAHVCPLPAVVLSRPARPLGALRHLASLARATGAVILHSHAPRAALYSGLAARLLGRRHVWHLRASRAGSAAADRLLLGLSDRAVAVSRAAASRSASLRLSRRVRVVPTGIRPPAFLEPGAARAELGLPEGGLVVGVVGRLERDKGGEDALAVLAGLRDAVPGATLVFLGRSDPADRWPMTLRLRASALGLIDNLRFTGERDEAARLFRAFDLILHPSRHEALPRVLIEALHAGVPVAAYAVGGVGEVVDDGVTGLLAPPRDIAALGAAALRLAAAPDLRRRLGDAGRRRAAARFSLDRMGADLVSIYADVLAHGKAGGVAEEAA